MDKAYDADRIREPLSYDGVEAVIPPIPTRARKLSYDHARYRERNLPDHFAAADRLSPASVLRTSVRPHLTQERGFHGGRDSINDGQARASTQVEVREIGSLATTGSMAFQLFAAQTLPAGSTATSVIIWKLPLWNWWMTSPGFVPVGRPLRLRPGHQHHTATVEVADPDVVITVDRHAPRHVDHIAAGEALRRGLGAVGADHVDHTSGHLGILHENLQHVRGGDLELFHDGHAVGDDRWQKVEGHVTHPP